MVSPFSVLFQISCSKKCITFFVDPICVWVAVESVGAHFADNAGGTGDFQADALCYQDTWIIRTGHFIPIDNLKISYAFSPLPDDSFTR